MGGANTINSVGNLVFRDKTEDDAGFIREHMNLFLVCMPSYFFTQEDERLHKIVACCKSREIAEAALGAAKHTHPESSVVGRTYAVLLRYPRQPTNVNAVEINLSDVRAADSIRIQYDFDRDGWAVFQATKFEWESGEETDPCWKESAFLQAWAYHEDT